MRNNTYPISLKIELCRLSESYHIDSALQTETQPVSITCMELEDAQIPLQTKKIPHNHISFLPENSGLLDIWSF